MAGTWPAVQCKRILFSEATNGIEVHPYTPWVMRKESGDEVEIAFLATKFGKPAVETKINMKLFVCNNIFMEYGGPTLAEPHEPFPKETSITTNQSGVAIRDLTAPTLNNPRGFIDGQLYPYVYWANSNPINPEEICYSDNFLYLLNSYFVIRVFDKFTYKEPPTWNEDVYPIFEKYAKLYPVMSLYYVDLGNYYDVTDHKYDIRKVLSLKKTHPNYMPVTRDLSNPKRDMILKWTEKPCLGEKQDLTIVGLRQNLQIAMEIEHATIPTYLTALATIKDNYNPQVQAIFRQILVQEMLHFALAANILNAVGGKPVLFSENFLPLYPTQLPGGVMPALQVPIEKCTIALISNIFMAIEQPSLTVDFESSPEIPGQNDKEMSPGTHPHQPLDVTGKYHTTGKYSYKATFF